METSLILLGSRKVRKCFRHLFHVNIEHVHPDLASHADGPRAHHAFLAIFQVQNEIKCGDTRSYPPPPPKPNGDFAYEREGMLVGLVTSHGVAHDFFPPVKEIMFKPYEIYISETLNESLTAIYGLHMMAFSRENSK